MKRPEGVWCSECAHYWWYAGMCQAYSANEELNIYPMSPESIDCDRFELKTRQEEGSENYDRLPRQSTIELYKEIYVKMCNDLLKRIAEQG